VAIFISCRCFRTKHFIPSLYILFWLYVVQGMECPRVSLPPTTLVFLENSSFVRFVTAIRIKPKSTRPDSIFDSFSPRNQFVSNPYGLVCAIYLRWFRIIASFLCSYRATYAPRISVKLSRRPRGNHQEAHHRKSNKHESLGTDLCSRDRREKRKKKAINR
jgi:hypothetical protein